MTSLEAMEEWQQILRLSDWDLELKVLSEKDYLTEFEEENVRNSLGCVAADYEHKCATIFMKDGVENMEFTLVHELVHIMIGKYANSHIAAIEHVDSIRAQEVLKEVEAHGLENAVNQITRALLSVRDASGTIRKESKK